YHNTDGTSGVLFYAQRSTTTDPAVLQPCNVGAQYLREPYPSPMQHSYIVNYSRRPGMRNTSTLTQTPLSTGEVY
ncbi:unnamed protein product, partial [Ectocarpus fasciculatus]